MSETSVRDLLNSVAEECLDNNDVYFGRSIEPMSGLPKTLALAHVAKAALQVWRDYDIGCSSKCTSQDMSELRAALVELGLEPEWDTIQ